MKRAGQSFHHAASSSPEAMSSHPADNIERFPNHRIDDNGTAASLIRHIASYMTLSDAASFASMGNLASTVSHASMGRFVRGDNDDHSEASADSWIVGQSAWSFATPPTPALVAISPGATPAISYAYPSKFDDLKNLDADDDRDDDSSFMMERLQTRRREWAQQKLAAAVFSHPLPLRSFCVDAYAAAQAIRNRQAVSAELDPETTIEPLKQHRREHKSLRLVHEMVDFIFHNVPMSVLFDVLDAVGSLSLDTTYASFCLTFDSINSIISALGYAARVVWDGILNFNPFRLIEVIISFQFNAMGKTSEVIASGIQSVATGVESASSLALHRLSGANLSVNLSANRNGSSSSLGGSGKSFNMATNKKLLKKMSSLNDAAYVVSFQERGDDTGGLTRHAMSRTRRMMHYSVSLRPFVATVTMPPNGLVTATDRSLQRNENGSGSSLSWSFSNDSDATDNTPNPSPDICSPQSFPPTPRSRQMVLTRGSQFADDVVFLARDRLRIHDALASQNERTREMAEALREGKRLAIFDGNGLDGIQLTCGQHIATKMGQAHYASARSMVPVLRNCHVYFEVTVMPRIQNDMTAPSAISMSIGVATVEMPLNTLVGAWQGSVGLCTNGHILTAGQWFSPPDPSVSAYTYNSTIGCLVFLDDSSAFETWDGVMVNASVNFSVNGVAVPPLMESLQLPTLVSEPSPAKIARTNSGGKRNVMSPVDKTPDSVGTKRNSEIGSLSGASVHSGSSASSVYTMPTLYVPSSEELYPTVTLQTPATAVMCRFSSEDVLAKTRESIGAPPGVAIYAVDASVIVDEDS